MTNQILYLLGVVAVGWAVTVGLRALPFVLFAGRNKALPPWVERVGALVSPVIIACLIVYSYSGLAWQTPWPYLAGLLTVALHLVLKNPLVSIVAGTVLYMCLLSAGCASSRMIAVDRLDTEIVYDDRGLRIEDRPTDILGVIRTLEDCEIPHDRVIHIRICAGTRDLGGARSLMGYLAKAGYTRSVLVTERHGEAFNPTRRPRF